MSLKTQLTEGMKTAMRAKDQVSLSTIRLINAAIKQFEVDERTEVDDAKVISILTKMVKQRKDSAEIKTVVEAVITETGASGMADMGKVMGVLKTRLAGKADMGEVNKVLKAALTA